MQLGFFCLHSAFDFIVSQDGWTPEMSEIFSYSALLLLFDFINPFLSQSMFYCNRCFVAHAVNEEYKWNPIKIEEKNKTSNINYVCSQSWCVRLVKSALHDFELKLSRNLGESTLLGSFSFVFFLSYSIWCSLERNAIKCIPTACYILQLCS